MGEVRVFSASVGLREPPSADGREGSTGGRDGPAPGRVPLGRKGFHSYLRRGTMKIKGRVWLGARRLGVSGGREGLTGCVPWKD